MPAPAQDDIQSTRIICEGGLDSTENHINMAVNKPGAATRLVNYEVGSDGGYRRILGYQPFDPEFPEVGVGVAEGPVLGLIIFDNSITDTTQIIAARKNISGNTYSFWLYTAGAGWSVITTGLTRSSVGVFRLRYDVGNDGSVNYLAIADGVNKAIVYDGMTWAQINSASSGSGMATAGGNQAVDAPSLIGFFEQTLFLGGDEIAKGTLAYSAPNAFFDFTVANGAGQATIGFPVVQFKPFRDSLFIFGKNAIKKAIADVASGFLVDGVTTNIGCVAPDSVVEIGGDLVFLAPDGFRPISGTNKIGDVQLETISKPIHELMKSRIRTVVNPYTCAVTLRSKSQFRLFFSVEGTLSDSSLGIIGGMRSADQQNGWEFGELRGFKPSCVTSQYIGMDEVILHGGFDGMVYIQETGNSLNGADMLSVYTTPYIDLGDTELRKVIEKVTLFVKATSDVLITMEVDYDWGDDDVPNPLPYLIEIDAIAAQYGTANEYGDGSTYGGKVKPKIIQDVEGTFFSIRAAFTTYGQSDPYAIHGIIYEYQVKGRR